MGGCWGWVVVGVVGCWVVVRGVWVVVGWWLGCCWGGWLVEWLGCCWGWVIVGVVGCWGVGWVVVCWVVVGWVVVG